MNANDKLNSLGDATVDDLMTANFGTARSDAVARHLAEVKAAYATLDTDAETSNEIDEAIAAADAELGLDQDDSSDTSVPAKVLQMPPPDDLPS